MAFSTQKDFLHVAFMNEHPEEKCIPMEGVKLKTYASTPDYRAWSMNKDKQAQYLIDLVSCRMYPGGEAGDGFQTNLQSDSRGTRDQRDPNAVQGLKDKLIPSLGDDSVLNVALEEMTNLERLVMEKGDLMSQLEVSQDKLRVLSEERQMINEILSNEHYPEVSTKLEKKINDLKGSAKINKNDEDELLKLRDDLRNREKACQVVDAQNCYLRRLVEKLSLRAGRMNSIPTEPENCTDVNYLQCEVNNLRKEVNLLRSLENEPLPKEGHVNSGDKDAENVAKIVAERNALREKCQHFAAIQGKIVQWKRDSEQFHCFRSDACCTLQKKDEEIQDLQEEIEELRYEIKKIDKCSKMKDQKGESLCTTLECLQDENRSLRDELCRCNCELKKITVLQNQLQCLTDELCEKNCAINQYDMQFQQLLEVIEDLKKKDTIDIRSLQDMDSQTHIEELAVSTRATLDQISKELLGRQEKDDENRENKIKLEMVCTKVKEIYAIIDQRASAKGDCVEQIDRLRAFIVEMKKETDSLKRTSTELLQHLETEQRKVSAAEGDPNELKRLLASAEERNNALNNALKQCQNQVNLHAEELNKLGVATDTLVTNLSSSQASIKEVGKLVKDINDVQERNDNLQSVLGAIDYQKEIDDLKKRLEEQKRGSCAEQNMELEALRKQLDDEKQKNAICTDQNISLQNALEQARSSGFVAESVPDTAMPSGMKNNTKHESNSSPSGAAAPGTVSKVNRRNSKLAQLQQVYETQRTAERTNYEHEIEGHRLTNEVLRSSLTKLASKMQSKTILEVEREIRRVLDDFAREICMWRCQKTSKKLNRLQEICKKIVDTGIDCLTYKELVYLHQQMSQAALKLKPKGSSKLTRRELTCCKCSGDFCPVPIIPEENEKVLLEKLAKLEHDIQDAGDTLRKIKKEQSSIFPDTEQMELETLRANTFRINNEIKNPSARSRSNRLQFTIHEELEVPTKDRYKF